MSCATTGSPTQPSPKDAKVMPSCVTDKDASRWSVSRLAYTARRLPSAIRVSSREERIFTQANSAATKKPFIKIKNATSTNCNSIGTMSKSYSLQKFSFTFCLYLIYFAAPRRFPCLFVCFLFLFTAFLVVSRFTGFVFFFAGAGLSPPFKGLKAMPSFFSSCSSL